MVLRAAMRKRGTPSLALWHFECLLTLAVVIASINNKILSQDGYRSICIYIYIYMQNMLQQMTKNEFHKGMLNISSRSSISGNGSVGEGIFLGNGDPLARWPARKHCKQEICM